MYCADLLIFHRDARSGFGVGVALRVAPNRSIIISSSTGFNSEHGTFEISGFSFKCPFGPTVPPMKMFTPGTMPFSPVGFLTCAPMRPMSATCTGAHEFGHPVQIMRTSFDSSNTLSKCSAISSAWRLVSICAKPQNWFPVHATMFETSLPGNGVYSWKRRSFKMASTLSFGTFGMMKFCSRIKSRVRIRVVDVADVARVGHRARDAHAEGHADRR